MRGFDYYNINTVSNTHYNSRKDEYVMNVK